jgi:hypothetical protein
MRITVLARRHFVGAAPATMRSRMEMVSGKDEGLFALRVGLLSIVYAHSAVPTVAAGLFPNVLPLSACQDSPRAIG